MDILRHVPDVEVLDELIPKMQIAFSLSLLVLFVTLVVGHKT